MEELLLVMRTTHLCPAVSEATRLKPVFKPNLLSGIEGVIRLQCVGFVWGGLALLLPRDLLRRCLGLVAVRHEHLAAWPRLRA